MSSPTMGGPVDTTPVMSGEDQLVAIIPAGLLRRMEAACPDMVREDIAKLLISKGTETILPVLVALFPEK